MNLSMKRKREQKVTTNMSFHSKLSKKSIQIFESNEISGYADVLRKI